MGIYMRMLNWSKGGFFLVLDINIVVVRMVKEGGTRETRVCKAVVLVIRELVLWRSLYHQRGAVIGYKV